MRDLCKNYIKEGIDEEWLSGGPDCWDIPTWSGKWMMDFFKDNPIAREEVTPEICDMMNDIISEGSDKSVPRYVFDDLCTDIVDEEAYTIAKKAIYETLTIEQLVAIEDASDVVRSLNYYGDMSKGDCVEMFFHQLYCQCAKISFEVVNGYEFPSETAAPVKRMNLDDCDFGGVYAFTCNASGLIKIGMSEKNVKGRVRGQMNSLPKGGEFLCAYPSSNPRAAESMAHHKFDGYRVSPRREWFGANERDVISYLMDELCLTERKGRASLPENKERS